MYWYFRYPAAEKGGKDVVVATSRPETMFGDVAIAVSPDDERYSDVVGQKVILPLVGREIPIITDPYPDPEKGTGAVKITPAHDPNDFEVGERHGLEIIACIDPDAVMNEKAGKYAGMDRYECRKAWVEDLEKAGYLVKTETLSIPVGKCYRCGTIIEPMLSEQWFVKMETLAKPAVEAAESGRLKHIPKRFEKTYLHWLHEIHDWCISRQLWWGHRIPAWYCETCGETVVTEETPKLCPKCGGAKLKQDEDVLDTWFSSALWPFSTLGWPDDTPELKYFYPTSVMVTGYDIIFFWVVRMVFSGCEAMKEIPFEKVYIHGLVRDSQGRKMSKSLGNGIDPLREIEKYGADALRFTLITGITPGNDMRYQDEKILAARNFANKLWNAARFAIMNLRDENEDFLPLADGAEDEDFDPTCMDLKVEDKWIVSRVNDAVSYVTDTMEKLDLALAGQRIYDLIWNEYCDWYIEIVKKRLWGDDEEDKIVVRSMLVYVLKKMLKLLHPHMPFITEEIWSYLPHSQSNSGKSSYLINAKWPKAHDAHCFKKEESMLATAMDAITAIRNVRAEANASPSRRLNAAILAQGEYLERIESAGRYIKELANIRELKFMDKQVNEPQDGMSAVIPGAQIFIPLEDLVDLDAELERLAKEKERLTKEVKRVEKKLSNESFTSKAPQKIVDEEKEKKVKYELMLEKVLDRIENVKSKVKGK